MPEAGTSNAYASSRAPSPSPIPPSVPSLPHYTFGMMPNCVEASFVENSYRSIRAEGYSKEDAWDRACEIGMMSYEEKRKEKEERKRKEESRVGDGNRRKGDKSSSYRRSRR